MKHFYKIIHCLPIASVLSGIFLFNAVTYAASEEDFPPVEAPFANSSENKNSELDEEKFPPVDEPFPKNHSSTVNHTEERGQ